MVLWSWASWLEPISQILAKILFSYRFDIVFQTLHIHCHDLHAQTVFGKNPLFLGPLLKVNLTVLVWKELFLIPKTNENLTDHSCYKLVIISSSEDLISFYQSMCLEQDWT